MGPTTTQQRMKRRRFWAGSVALLVGIFTWRGWLLASQLNGVAFGVVETPHAAGGGDASGASVAGAGAGADVDVDVDATGGFGKDAVNDSGDVDLPIGKRLTVLVSKEMIKTIATRDEAAQAFVKAEEELLRTGRKPTTQKDLSVERHFTRGYWFVRGTKYFVYQPSGGMSNQRIMLEHALLVARALGRTLVVPPVCPHTSMFWNYNKVEWDRTVEGFAVFEKLRMEQAVPVLGLSNTILRRFVEFNEFRKTLTWKRVEREKGSSRGKPWTTKDMVRIFGDDDEDVIFFAKYTMWKSFLFTDAEIEFAQNHVQLDSEFRKIARVATQALFGTGPFNAIHSRFEDKYTQILTDKLSPAQIFVRRLEKLQALQKSTNLYVATQPSKIGAAYFEPFRKHGFELTFSDKLSAVPEVQAFLQRFPQNDIQSTVLGLVEQLVCARASVFTGTGFSTFSFYIRIKRNNPVLVFDESLLPRKFKFNDVFLQTCDARMLQKAFEDPATNNDDVIVEHERVNIVGRPPTCQTDIVSLLSC